MDSLSPGEGGYLTEGPLGYPWASQTARPGLAPLTRIYDGQVGNPSTGDHALMVAADALHSARVLLITPSRGQWATDTRGM